MSDPAVEAEHPGVRPETYETSENPAPEDGAAEDDGEASDSTADNSDAEGAGGE